MKWINYTGHPVLLMSMYLLLLIESEHFGGFYLLYLLMALPVGSPFAIVAVVGLVSVFVGYKVYRKQLHPLKPILYLLGYCLLLISLMLFFNQKDRLETFQLILPTITFIFFSICSLCFLIHSFSLLVKFIKPSNDKLNVMA